MAASLPPSSSPAHGMVPQRGLDLKVTIFPAPARSGCGPAKRPRICTSAPGPDLAAAGAGAPPPPPPPPPTAPGRFGRMFDHGAYGGYQPDEAALEKLAETMREVAGPENDNPDLPVGFVFLGQFVDHDLTLDATTSLGKLSDPAGVSDFRTPAFDLDSVYLGGPDTNRLLYSVSRPGEGQLPVRLLVDRGRPFDLPRNSENTAIIGDPRNDENFLISQLHLAFLKFHNAIVDWLSSRGEGRLLRGDGSPWLDPQGNPQPDNRALFAQAQTLARYHYQWILVHEFLPKICEATVLDDVAKNGRKLFLWEKTQPWPFMPVEFAGAAYRLGHTIVRDAYQINARNARRLFDLPVFGTPRLENVDGEDTIDWRRFFQFPGELPPQLGRKFDAKVAPSLFSLPFIDRVQDRSDSLPLRNFLRARVFDLPSGQQAAKLMQAAGLPVQILDNRALGIDRALDKGLLDQAPLWFYVLKESELTTGGRTLGPVGSRIVGEVFYGLLRGPEGGSGDPAEDARRKAVMTGSYLHDLPDFEPTLPTLQPGVFGMADLLRFAGA